MKKSTLIYLALVVIAGMALFQILVEWTAGTEKYVRD